MKLLEKSKLICFVFKKISSECRKYNIHIIKYIRLMIIRRRFSVKNFKHLMLPDKTKITVTFFNHDLISISIWKLLYKLYRIASLTLCFLLVHIYSNTLSVCKDIQHAPVV